MSPSLIINARFLSQPITGVQRFSIELSRELKRKIPNLIFVAPDNIKHSEIAEELEVKIIGRIKNGFLWEQVELPVLLRQYGKPVLVNFYGIVPILYSKNIVTIHDLSFVEHPEWFSKRFALLYNTFTPIAIRTALKIITVSEYSRQAIAKHYSIDPAQIDIVSPSVSPIFRVTSIKTNSNLYGRYILAVSSLDPRKNFKNLILAFKKAQLENIKLVIVGAKHKVFASNDLDDLLKDDLSIIFTGYVNDAELVNLYRNAMFFVYPSLFEGFGIPPLEAMACGCPTIVANVTSLPEVCAEASVYVNPYNVESITAKLIELAYNEPLRQQLVLKGFKRLEQFSWENSATKMVSIIENLSV